MKKIHAIFENGVFRPKGQVDLPNLCEVEFEPHVIQSVAEYDESIAGIYDILSRNYETGDPNIAASHNEHRP